MSKIPSHAIRVFKGKIFDVWQWQQQLYDGTTATFEAMRRPATTVVMALVGEDILFAKQEQPGKPGFYSLFGGRVEEDEDVLFAAQRELLEEAGLESDDWTLWKRFSPGGSKIDWDVYYFIARNCKQVAAQNLDAGERIEVRRMPLEQFLREIVPLPSFSEEELRAEILSSFNNERTAAIFAVATGVNNG